MSNKDAALKLAREALKLSAITVNSFGVQKKVQQAVAEIDEALAEPAQEPVACIHKGYLYMAHEFMSGIPDGATLLYTTPPQRPWVGLTEEERLYFYRKYEDILESDDWEYEKAIEAKLKERNHG